jgi:hypothetical protein
MRRTENASLGFVHWLENAAEVLSGLKSRGRVKVVSGDISGMKRLDVY